jgi:radical SAM superfamily enzyme YgiQ (UPF0313 family)
MKLLFINPCLRKGASLKILPVGLASVMTYVHQQGFEFDLLDIDINEYDDTYVEDYIKNNHYDVILFGSIITHYKWIKWLTKTIKSYYSDTIVIVGNSVAGSCYEVFLENIPADIVVIGEGEITATKTLKAIQTGQDLTEISGIAFRNSSAEIVKNPPRKACNINDLPLIDWDFFDVSRYLAKSSGAAFGDDNENTVVMPVSTARGCAFKCTFCHYVFWNDPYRTRDSANIMQEIKRDIEKYGATYFNFWDDLSFASLPQVERIVDAILESGLQFKWDAAIRSDLFGKTKWSYQKRLKLAKKMRQSGCVSVGYSLESGNNEILKMMQKHIKPEYFREQIKLLKEAEIVSNTSVVFGYPIETKETIKETFDMCLESGIYPSIGFLLPLPATGMYEYAKEHDFITDEDAFLTSITERQDICLNMTQLSDQEILAEIDTHAKNLNAKLDLNLKADALIKTGGYKDHTNVKKQLDKEDKLRRKENDLSLGYGDVTFTKV